MAPDWLSPFMSSDRWDLTSAAQLVWTKACAIERKEQNGAKYVAKAYIVQHEWEANLKVYIVQNEWEAQEKIYAVQHEWEAGMRVYVVQHEWEANLKVYIVQHEWEA
jgi:hypothetical protein